MPLDMRGIFSVGLIKHWNRLPREVVEFHMLEIFEIWLDRALGSASLRACFQKEAGLVELRKSPTELQNYLSCISLCLQLSSVR